METLKVRDLMTREVEVINSCSDVHELEKLLLEKRIHGVPVVDENGSLVGVASQTDLLAWHYDYGVDGGAYYDYSNLIVRDDEEFKGLKLSDIQSAPVKDMMSPVVHFIRPDRPVAVAASTMIQKRLHRLVVVDDKFKVMGIISALDVLLAVPGVDQLVEMPAPVVNALEAGA